MSIFKNFWGSMPPDPSRVVFATLVETLPGKTTLEKVTKFGAPSLIKKFLKTPLTWQQFQRAYLCRPFPGLNVITSLCLVNIQPNLKLHPPTKTFWIRPYLPITLGICFKYRYLFASKSFNS